MAAIGLETVSVDSAAVTKFGLVVVVIAVSVAVVVARSDIDLNWQHTEVGGKFLTAP